MAVLPGMGADRDPSTDESRLLGAGYSFQQPGPGSSSTYSQAVFTIL